VRHPPLKECTNNINFKKLVSGTGKDVCLYMITVVWSRIAPPKQKNQRLFFPV